MNPRVAFRAIAPCLLLAIVCCCGRAPGESPGTPPASEADRKIRESVVTEVTAALDQARAKLADLNKQLDDLAGQGKYVDVARVYWAALDWCVRDASRLLEAEELPLVEQARPLAAAILERLADPQQVLGRVLDQAPQEGDPLRSKENPFFQSVLAAVRPATQKEETWAKGRKGYLSIPNAWTFSGMGSRLYGIVWPMTRPASPLRHHPMLLANALSLLDTIAHQHTDGDFNVDRTAVYGRDPNINRFCLAPALDAWWELGQAYPDLLPAAKRVDLEAGLKRLADYQVTDYGLARLAKQPHVKQPAYPNMDVHHVLIMELARRFWGEDPYAKERDAFVKILDSAVYPGGAWTYICTQNECFVYHQIDVLYSARFWKLTRNPTTLAMLQRTMPFYPYNVEPAGVPEYYTDACWKHYWGGAEAAAPSVIASLFDDPRNARVAEIAEPIYGYGEGHYAAIAADFWKPVHSQPLPDRYVIFDQNVEGPRGRYGPWSFAGNGRNYGVGYQGKDTFVGAMITDAERRPLSLDAALQVVTTEVRLNQTDNHWRGGLCHSALERLTTTLGPDFGSLAVRYQVSKPQWHYKYDELFPWEGTQAWYLSRTRLVGLVALEATADETRAAVHGRIRLGLKRDLEPGDDGTWKYGRLRVKLHAHNYAKVVAKPSETFYLDKPEKYRSTEITLVDPLSVAAGEQGTVAYPKGTRYWFLVEIRPESSPPAENVERIESGLVVGFRFREPGRTVCMLHNPTEQPADVELPAGFPAGVTTYRDNSGKGAAVEGSPWRTRLDAHQHLVAVAADGK